MADLTLQELQDAIREVGRAIEPLLSQRSIQFRMAPDQFASGLRLQIDR
jgi:hypothetical protein